ncbi:MAG TPA: GNAT family N-acetyltransferase [Woeseiaceae bacterium]|nr:GNAT family N-acetyltransferase [Woeseiaceae bacterium]
MDQTLLYGFVIAMALFGVIWMAFVMPAERRHHARKLAIVQKRIAEHEARLAERARAPGPVIETARLALRELTVDDAAFLKDVMNDAGFLKYIGDRGIRTLDDARAYLERGPLDSYRRHGYGMYLVTRRADDAALGICGLVRRDSLDAPDLGFAFLPPYRSQGYASEAAAATLEFGRKTLGLARILAIATPDNGASNRILRKCGMRLERRVRLPPDDSELNLYVCPAG